MKSGRKFEHVLSFNIRRLSLDNNVHTLTAKSTSLGNPHIKAFSSFLYSCSSIVSVDNPKVSRWVSINVKQDKYINCKQDKHKINIKSILNYRQLRLLYYRIYYACSNKLVFYLFIYLLTLKSTHPKTHLDIYLTTYANLQWLTSVFIVFYYAMIFLVCSFIMYVKD